MAGATNRAFKAAGIPKKAQAEIRVHAGGRLTLAIAVDVARKHGIALPDKVHAHMAATAAEGRKAALREASAQRGAKVARALGDASKATMANRKARAAIDAAAKSGKGGGMRNGEIHTYGTATVTKQVLRSAVAQRSTSTGTKYGTRQFSDTSYIVKNNGKTVDILSSHKDAVSLAKKHGGVSEPEGTSATIKLGATLTPAARKSLREMGYGVDERGGDAITTRARDRHALRTGQSVRRTARVLILSKRDGSPMTDRDVQHARAAIEAAAK
jgi:hypothetical protein